MIFVLALALNIWVYAFLKCDSFIMKVMPAREIPGRCLTYVK